MTQLITLQDTEKDDTQVVLRVPASLKNEWVCASQRDGKKLTAWLLERIVRSAPLHIDKKDANKIRLLRESMGLSQRAMADRLDVTLATWQRIESGQNQQTHEPVEIDMRTRLALAALAASLEPF